MNPKLFVQNALVPALRMLPQWMDSKEGRACLLAILFQESRLTYRRQLVGPARGYPQFELTGVRAVLSHEKVGPTARLVLQNLDYFSTDPDEMPLLAHTAVEHNDILACALARLLLYSEPKPLPKKEDVEEGWRQYLRNWRPGRPRPESWNACWTRAWNLVESTGEEK